MFNTAEADIFFNTCRDILDDCIIEIQKEFVASPGVISRLLILEAKPDDLFVFFNSESGKYEDAFIKLLKKYSEVEGRIWPIAFTRDPACRQPPFPADKCQSFDISCWNENRNPLTNNIPAIAHMFARKIIAQVLSPLYRDEVLYFISHRRSDGEHIAGILADQLSLLTRQKRAYRDVVAVSVGDEAQADIDRHLRTSDALIFIQTEDAQHSEYILKELCYALVNDIPVLWIQIDGASFKDLRILPGERPALSYSSSEFNDPKRIIEIATEVEENCFRLIMNSSNQICSYIECLNELAHSKKITLTQDKSSVLAFEIGYKTSDIFNPQNQQHYIQCYGREPKQNDVQAVIERVTSPKFQFKSNTTFVLSKHRILQNAGLDDRIIIENYDNYIAYLENVTGKRRDYLGKRIILSGAFPDCDEIYKNSLLEALSVYAKQIIRRGYTLVFGAHPTFQKIIFEIGTLYAPHIRNSIEMHMDRAYADAYDIPELQEKCKLVLADGLPKMRRNMICKERCELLICLGGKIKEDKAQQGVDIEIQLARSSNIPVVLVGTVGGRSSEYALELAKAGDWSCLNSFGRDLNKALLYCMNHRLMISKLLDRLSDAQE